MIELTSPWWNFVMPNAILDMERCKSLFYRSRKLQPRNLFYFAHWSKFRIEKQFHPNPEKENDISYFLSEQENEKLRLLGLKQENGWGIFHTANWDDYIGGLDMMYYHYDAPLAYGLIALIISNNIQDEMNTHTKTEAPFSCVRDHSVYLNDISIQLDEQQIQAYYLDRERHAIQNQSEYNRHCAFWNENHQSAAALVFDLEIELFNRSKVALRLLTPEQRVAILEIVKNYLMDILLHKMQDSKEQKAYRTQYYKIINKLPFTYSVNFFGYINTDAATFAECCEAEHALWKTVNCHHSDIPAPLVQTIRQLQRARVMPCFINKKEFHEDFCRHFATDFDYRAFLVAMKTNPVPHIRPKIRIYVPESTILGQAMRMHGQTYFDKEW